MNKTLRLSLLAVLMAFSGSLFAQDIIWMEDWTGFEDSTVPSAMNSNYSEKGTVYNEEDGTIKSGTKIYASENLAGGTAPELLVAKSEGSFTALVSTQGKSGATTLTWKCNQNLTVTVSAAGTELVKGENLKGTDCELNFDIPAGTSQLEIKFSNTQSRNSRLDDIKLFQGQGLKSPGLTFGTSERTVTLGAEDYTFPELKNDNQVQVNFDSSDPGVATIDAGGDITLVAAGKTIISATFYGDGEYEAQTASYTLIVKDAVDQTQYNVAEALAIIDALGNGDKTDKEYYVKGTVTQVEEIKTSGGNATFFIGDGTNTLYIYRAKGLQKKNITDENYLKEGDAVVVFGKLQKYVKNDEVTPEMASGGYIYELNGRTEDEGSTEPTPTEEIKTATVAEFNAAAESTNVWYQLTGTVKNLKEGDLYGNFDLEDATGSVYVYGVLSEKGGDKKLFQDLVAAYGIKNGSVITIIGNRGSYKEKIEVVNAYFVSVDNSGASEAIPGDFNGDGNVSVADIVTIANAIAAGSKDLKYDVSGDGNISVADIVAIANIIASK